DREHLLYIALDVTGQVAPAAGHQVPTYRLSDLLGIPAGHNAPRVALFTEAGGQQGAVLVDEAHDGQELAVRALPRHLRRRSVRGAAVGANGQVLLLLDIPTLLGRLLSRRGGTPASGGTPRQIAGRLTARPAGLEAPRVLIVDDSVTIRHVLAQALSRAGLAVETARDGLDALRVMARAMPQVIVLDLEMPRMNGLEFLAELRASPQLAAVPVIVLTSR